MSMRNIQYVSADIESPSAMMKFDITDIPLDNNSFDVIFCIHVLEHIPHDKKAMSELYRILRPGGWAILQSPVDYGRTSTFEPDDIASSRDRESFFGQCDHVRIYGLDYGLRLREAGFEVQENDYTRGMSENSIIKYAIIKNEKVYHCVKPNVGGAEQT